MTDQLIHSETVVSTPFQAFLTALQERQAKGVSNSMHSAIWTAVPIERLLVDASWTLASVVASKLGLTFSTHKEVRLAAQLTDQMINAGLMLVHGTPAVAAEAFEVKVIGAINLAMANGYRPGHTLSKTAWRALGNGQTSLARNELRGQKAQAFGALTSLWTLPSFLFLFDCYKASRDLCDDLAKRMSEFGRSNMIPTGRLSRSEMFDHLKLPYVADDHLVSEAIAYLDIAGVYLDTERSPEYRVRKGKINEVLVAASVMEQLELRLSTLMAVAIDFKALSGEALNNASSMDVNWIRGQVLCAVIGHRGESLHPATYGKALKMAKLQTIDQLVDKTVAAILRRGTKWTVEQTNCFRQMCAIQAWEVHLAQSFGVESFGESMTVVSVDSIKITSEMALEILLDGDQAFNGLLDQMSSQKVRTFLEKKLLPKIDWSMLDVQTVMEVIGHQRVPLDLILDGVAKTEVEVRETVVKNLLRDRTDPQDALVSELTKRGLMVIDLELIKNCAQELPANLLFDWLMAHPEQLELLTIAVRFRAISRLQKRQLHELCQLTVVRRPLVDLFSVLIRASARVDYEIKDYHLDEFRLLMGRDLWREFVAAALVFDRIAERTLEADPDHPRLSWLAMADQDHPDYTENDRAMLTTPGNPLTKLLVEYSEERAFRFLHEGNPQVERLWRDYLAH